MGCWGRSGPKWVEGRIGAVSGVGRLAAISRFAGDGQRLGTRLGPLRRLRASVTRAARPRGGEGRANSFASFYKSWPHELRASWQLPFTAPAGPTPQKSVGSGRPFRR